MEKAIVETCSIVLDMQVHEDEEPAKKVGKLALVIKDSKDIMAKLKFEHEVQISEL